jgi:hypothetical protein
VAESVEKGNRYSNLVKSIQQEHAVSVGRARLIARQETKSLIGSYAEERYIAAGATEYLWKCVHGSALHPVRPIHQALNDASQKKGQTYRFDDPPIISEDGRRGNPGDDFNCFFGGSKIDLTSNARKFFRRWYTGKVTKLVTSTGKTLTLTPNHPVLTLRGWVAAQDVKMGDYLIQATGESLSTNFTNIDDSKASFQECFDALSIVGNKMNIAGTTSQFHNDGLVDEKVDVVFTDRLLRNNVKSKFFQTWPNFFFTAAEQVWIWFVKSATSTMNQLKITGAVFFSNFVSSFCQGPSFIFSSPFHADIHGVRNVSNIVNSKHLEAIVDGSSRTVKLSRQCLGADAFKVKLLDLFRWIFCDRVSMLRASRRVHTAFSKPVPKNP